MPWFMRLFSRRRRYDDLTVSINEHIAERAEELMEDGIPRADAEQIARREFELIATVLKPAEIERQRIETIANAERQRLISEAEGRH